MQGSERGKPRHNGIRRQDSEGGPRLCAKGNGEKREKKGKEKQVEEIQRERYTGEWHNGD